MKTHATQGTDDFIDAAVDSLRQGGHPFLLVALHARHTETDRKFSIRSGFFCGDDIGALREIARVEVPRHLDEDEERVP
jgi:hypothetical protein